VCECWSPGRLVVWWLKLNLAISLLENFKYLFTDFRQIPKKSMCMFQSKQLLPGMLLKHSLHWPATQGKEQADQKCSTWLHIVVISSLKNVAHGYILYYFRCISTCVRIKLYEFGETLVNVLSKRDWFSTNQRHVLWIGEVSGTIWRRLGVTVGSYVYY
jgi:hypothetical protein